MRGSVDVQSKARLSYKVVVMLTDALFTLGMLKLTSLMVARVAEVNPATTIYRILTEK